MSIFGGPKKMQEMVTPPSPQVIAEPTTPDIEKLKRAGRASLLINTSSTGVLGNPKTGKSTLLSAT